MATADRNSLTTDIREPYEQGIERDVPPATHDPDTGLKKKQPEAKNPAHSFTAGSSMLDSEAITADQAYPELAKNRDREVITGRFSTGIISSEGKLSTPRPLQFHDTLQPHGTLTITPPEDSEPGSLDVLEQMLARGRRMIDAVQPTEGIQVRVNRFGSMVKSITLSW